MRILYALIALIGLAAAGVVLSLPKRAEQNLALPCSTYTAGPQATRVSPAPATPELIPGETTPGQADTQTTITSSPMPESTPQQPVPQSLQPTPNLRINPEVTWNLIFGDDFNNNHLDLNKWVTCYWWDNQGCTNKGNHELEWYLPANIVFDQNTLLLEARKQSVVGSDGVTYPYTSGMVTTGRDTSNQKQPPKFAFQYGFAEIRAKVPSGKGLWPAFWMLPADNSAVPEIDVMEVIGDHPNVVNVTIHHTLNDGRTVKNSQELISPTDLSKDWHTYAVDWEPGSVTWYLDGVAGWQLTDPALIPSTPMYLLLNLAVGGDWPGDPNAQTPFPSAFAIDYVRVWHKAG